MNKQCELFYELQQGSDEWFDTRRSVCTSSEVGGLYAAKKGFETYLVQKEAERYLAYMDPSFVSEAMKRGTELEPIARDIFQKEQLLSVKECGFVLRKDLNAGWSPDGIICLPDDKFYAIEIKCRNVVNHYRVFKEGIDMPTYQQMQFAMAITDIPMMYFVAYNPDFIASHQMFIQKIEISRELQANTLRLLKIVKEKIGL